MNPEKSYPTRSAQSQLTAATAAIAIHARPIYGGFTEAIAEPGATVSRGVILAWPWVFRDSGSSPYYSTTAQSESSTTHVRNTLPLFAVSTSERPDPMET